MNLNICINCQIEMVCQHQGIALISMTTEGPQSVYSADLYKCPICENKSISGRANEPEMIGQGILDYLIYQTNRGRILIPYWLNARERRLSVSLEIYLDKYAKEILRSGR